MSEESRQRLRKKRTQENHDAIMERIRTRTNRMLAHNYVQALRNPAIIKRGAHLGWCASLAELADDDESCNCGVEVSSLAEDSA